MGVDFKKLKPADLKKLAAMAKAGKSGSKGIESAKKSAQELSKQAKGLADLIKKNPDV